jgi:hypothetical protein
MTAQSARVKTYAISGATPTWFPTNTALTGTISTFDTRVIGVGTAFKTEINAGDFLIDSVNIARKVHCVESDTEMQLEAPFSSNLAAETCTAVQNEKIRSLVVLFTTNAGTIKCASQDTPAAWPAAQQWAFYGEDVYQEPQLVTPGAAGGFVIEMI